MSRWVHSVLTSLALSVIILGGLLIQAGANSL